MPFIQQTPDPVHLRKAKEMGRNFSPCYKELYYLILHVSIWLNFRLLRSRWNHSSDIKESILLTIFSTNRWTIGNKISITQTRISKNLNTEDKQAWNFQRNCLFEYIIRTFYNIRRNIFSCLQCIVEAKNLGFIIPQFPLDNSKLGSYSILRAENINFTITSTSETSVHLSVCPSRNNLYFVCTYLLYGSIEFK